MKNDLSSCKIGDHIWSIQSGWEKIIKINCSTSYPIQTTFTNFTLQGHFDIDDVAPSAFIVPPKCFNAEPKPCDFEVDDKVLVSNADDITDSATRSYFSHQKNGKYHCFADGCTKWSTDGTTIPWKYCKKAE